MVIATLYENVKAISAQRGISIAELERKADLSVGSICKWDVVSPSVKNLKKVTDVLGIGLDELVDYEEE